MRGLFFVIDGGDGSGKATQTKLAAERLSMDSPPVKTFSFPDYASPTGRLVKAYLKGNHFGHPANVDPRLASALYAADRDAKAPEIAEALRNGTHVITDRYVSSNMGHQGTKFDDDAERAAFFAWNDHYEHVELGIPRPDLSIILHVPAETSMELIRARGNETDGHETLEHLKKAERVYLEIASKFPGFHLIECVESGSLLSREVIHERVWGAISNAVAQQRIQRDGAVKERQM